MEIVEGIKTRRSIGLVKPDPVPQELIEQILEAGTYAPNHFRTEPWRFFVLTGEGRNKLGNVFEEITAAKFEDPNSEDNQKKIEKAKKNPLRAPVIIAVGVEPSERKNVIKKEEYAAVNSAIQNMLLASHSLGLGAIWRTGDICYHEKVKNFFGLSEAGEIVAFVYIGYANMEAPKVKKTNFKELTTWID
ncbi:nitroreductase [Peribacillus cavernae]|jgi:nitroreductase|uniref:Putative NAD(P)H nitroreductase n=1 Tax=Peribacillus cavernae TaxID=1674310 RepID=A0A3S0W0G2_9BACI|nr:nitroreductase [Peribacillus cavernae]MDQ0217648.1 nitroreductase [Peribacillus cavernae]RUQ29925.1 nitroreductase [Peribacillus cavernae]